MSLSALEKLVYLFDVGENITLKYKDKAYNFDCDDDAIHVSIINYHDYVSQNTEALVDGFEFTPASFDSDFATIVYEFFDEKILEGKSIREAISEIELIGA